MFASQPTFCTMRTTRTQCTTRPSPRANVWPRETMLPRRKPRDIPAVQTNERSEATQTDPNTTQRKLHQTKIILTKTNHHIKFLTKCRDQRTTPTGLQIQKQPNITQMTDTFIENWQTILRDTESRLILLSMQHLQETKEQLEKEITDNDIWITFPMTSTHNNRPTTKNNNKTTRNTSTN